MAAHLFTKRAADTKTVFKKVKDEPFSVNDSGFHQQIESSLSGTPACFSIETDLNRLNTATTLAPPYSDSDHRLESSVENSVVKCEQVFASSTLLEKEVSVKGSGISRPAQLLLDTIKKNRMCQKNLHSTVELIEALIEENKKLKDGVKVSTDFQVPVKKVRRVSQMKDPHVQLISSQKVNAAKFGPESNRDTASYKDAMRKFQLTSLQKKGSPEEIDNLSYAEKCNGTSSDIDNALLLASMKGLELTPENIRAFLPQVSWDEFASIHNQGRSGAECETRWLNWKDPLINNTKWTRTEDKELLVLVKEKEMSNWIDIAVALGTNRTPFQCLARFQRSLNAQMVKREWEEEEDAHLTAAVRTFGESNWEKVASVLERRTGVQCYNRWKSSLNPVRVRVGRWTTEEDKHLKVSVKLLGAKCWDKISQFVPGRTQVQCRERWINCLDPSLNWDPWTDDEDTKLMAAIKEHSHCWTKIAACIPPRTDNQCRRRWMALCPDDVLKLQAVKRIQKASLVSNFVGRSTERPDLEPEEFLPLPLPLPLPLTPPVSELNSEQPSNKRKRKPRSDIQTKKQKQKCCKVTEKKQTPGGVLVGRDIGQFPYLVKQQGDPS